jgi:P27 family predicted phage terminase small subunit
VSRAADPKVDLPRVKRWIGALDEYERVNEVFKNTRLVKGSTGQPSLNPLAAYLSALAAELRAAEYELGLTPLARLRLGIAYGEARLTAEALNRALDARMEQPREDVEDWEADWGDAP